jgi:GT2 family glycosyltransferase
VAATNHIVFTTPLTIEEEPAVSTCQILTLSPQCLADSGRQEMVHAIPALDDADPAGSGVNASEDEMTAAASPLPHPVVSVVIPVRDAAEFVGAAVESALAQSFGALEVIVADDGSTDGSREIVEAMTDDRIRLLPGGPSNSSSARNRAISAARGELVAFLDADDLWYDDKLEKQVAVFDDPSVVAVGSLFRFRIRDRVFGVRGEQLTPEREELVKSARLMPLTFSSLVVRRSALIEVGLLDESVDMAADLDLLAKLANRGRVIVLDELLGEYRIRGSSLSRMSPKDHQMWVRFVEERTAARLAGGELTWSEYVARADGPTRREMRQAMAARRYRDAASHLAAKRYPPALVDLASALLTDPVFVLRKAVRQKPWR